VRQNIYAHDHFDEVNRRPANLAWGCEVTKMVEAGLRNEVDRRHPRLRTIRQLLVPFASCLFSKNFAVHALRRSCNLADFLPAITRELVHLHRSCLLRPSAYTWFMSIHRDAKKIGPAPCLRPRRCPRTFPIRNHPRKSAVIFCFTPCFRGGFWVPMTRDAPICLLALSLPCI
jgi:hypothetical protein